MLEMEGDKRWVTRKPNGWHWGGAGFIFQFVSAAMQCLVMCAWAKFQKKKKQQQQHLISSQSSYYSRRGAFTDGRINSESDYYGAKQDKKRSVFSFICFFFSYRFPRFCQLSMLVVVSAHACLIASFHPFAFSQANHAYLNGSHV